MSYSLLLPVLCIQSCRRNSDADRAGRMALRPGQAEPSRWSPSISHRRRKPLITLAEGSGVPLSAGIEMAQRSSLDCCSGWDARLQNLCNPTDYWRFDWSDIPLHQSNISEFLKLESSSHQLIERCQKESFEEELHCLKKGKAIRSTSRLLQLSPFLGSDN